MRFRLPFRVTQQRRKSLKLEVKDVFWSIVAPPQKKRDTIHLFTYARLRQMLNNSSTEADNMQLYLGYGGAWVLFSLA